MNRLRLFLLIVILSLAAFHGVKLCVIDMPDPNRGMAGAAVAALVALSGVMVAVAIPREKSRENKK